MTQNNENDKTVLRWATARCSWLLPTAMFTVQTLVLYFDLPRLQHRHQLKTGYWMRQLLYTIYRRLYSMTLKHGYSCDFTLTNLNHKSIYTKGSYSPLTFSVFPQSPSRTNICLSMWRSILICLLMSITIFIYIVGRPAESENVPASIAI